MTKHTPGPWHVINQWERPNSAVATIEPGPDTMEGPNYWTVAHANTLRPEHQANARLIAAAPDLLEALQALLASSMSDPNKRRSNEGRWKTINARTEAVEAARAAIAKATQSA